MLSAPPQLSPSILVASEPKGGLSEPRPRAAGALKQQAQEVRGASAWGGWDSSPDLGLDPCPSPRSSVCRLSSREKISLQDLSKERRPGGAGGPPLRDEDEGEEAPAGRDSGLLSLRKRVGLGFWGPRISEATDISCDVHSCSAHRPPTCGTKSPQWRVFPCVLQPQEPCGESEHPELM